MSISSAFAVDNNMTELDFTRLVIVTSDLLPCDVAADSASCDKETGLTVVAAETAFEFCSKCRSV